jgi:RNA polymerase sigma-70 factor (ECF subfamily)
MASKAPPETDAELVAAVLAGKRERYGELVERYQARLVNYLLRLVRSQEEALDLAQEVFLKVYQALARYDARYKFSTWLFRVAQNAAIDQLRRRRLQWISLDHPTDEPEDGGWEFPSGERGPYGHLRNQERGSAIQRSIDALPWEYRELIVLRHFAELSYDEIAQLKAMPLGTVKNKLFRARQMLKGCLEEYRED